MKKKIVYIFSIIIGLLTTVCSKVSLAFGPSDIYGAGTADFNGMGSKIAGYIVYFGLVIAVGGLMVKGIKYMVASVEAKADIKKDMIPWAIGVILLLSISVILNFIVNIASDINNIESATSYMVQKAEIISKM